MEFKKDDSGSIPKSPIRGLYCKIAFIKLAVNKGSVPPVHSIFIKALKITISCPAYH